MLPQLFQNAYDKLRLPLLFEKSVSKAKVLMNESLTSNGYQNVTLKVGVVAVSGTLMWTLYVALFKWRRIKKKEEGDRMKGVTASKYDGIKALEITQNLQKPRLSEPDEVLIEVKAVSVDSVDVRILHGYAKSLFAFLSNFNKSAKNEFPVIPGRDCSGLIVEVGSEVRSLKKGDQIWAFAPPWQPGLMTEFAVLKETQVDKKPANLSFETAASIPYAALMTWDALVRHAKLGPDSTAGKRVLIHIGSSACGSLAIQLVKQWGGHVTTTVPTNGLPLVRMLGADDVIVYSVTDFKDELQAREKFDVVLNTVGSVIHELCVELCVPGGSTVSTVATFSAKNNNVNFLYTSWEYLKCVVKEVLKSSAKNAHLGNFAFNKNVLGKIKELLEEGKLEPVVEEVFSFDQSLSAFQRVEGGDSVGRTVVKMS